MLSNFVGKPISAQIVTGYAQEQLDVVLLPRFTTQVFGE